jgi:hypothetical protein
VLRKLSVLDDLGVKTGASKFVPDAEAVSMFTRTGSLVFVEVSFELVSGHT